MTEVVGSLHVVDGVGVVRMEDRFGTTIEDLWSALTDPARLGRWLGEIEGDLRLGGEFKARFHASGWAGTGRVEVCEAPRRLVVNTVGADEGERHVMEANLTSDGDTTVLILEERGMPVGLLSAYGAGVQIHVEDLAAHVAGQDRGDGRERWEQLHPAYQALAGELGR
ncbi:SRPBCC family protein [Actinoplanes sp. HUAS TT8]|uniref:SRPBCC family protein n=1 Tax=Actinoplanes sp. HUAS TT8 TaxID=3447453 RepID=UPI003F521ABA